MTESFTLLRQGLPAWLERRVVRIESGARVPYVGADWRGALAVLEHGSVVLVALGGERLRVDEGAVLCLAGLPLATVDNERNGPAIIAPARRRAQAAS